MGILSVYRLLFISMFKVILGSLGAFPIFNKLVCQKKLAVEQNRPKIGPGEGGGVTLCTQGTF